jgi:hypothetical protein
MEFQSVEHTTVAKNSHVVIRQHTRKFVDIVLSWYRWRSEVKGVDEAGACLALSWREPVGSLGFVYADVLISYANSRRDYRLGATP